MPSILTSFMTLLYNSYKGKDFLYQKIIPKVIKREKIVIILYKNYCVNVKN